MGAIWFNYLTKCSSSGWLSGQAILTEVHAAISIIGNARNNCHLVYVLPSAGLSRAMCFEVRAFDNPRMQSRNQFGLSLL